MSLANILKQNTNRVDVFTKNLSVNGVFLSKLQGRTIINCSVKEDLAGTLDSSKLYVVDGFIDMGNTSIVVPQGGLAITGLGFGISGLFSSSNNYTMFTYQNFSGDLFMNKLEITVSGTNSKVFNLFNNELLGATEFDTVNFNGCTDVGILDSYRQFLGINLGFFGCNNGFTFEGIWNGIRVSTSIIRGQQANSTVFKKGFNLSFSGRVLSDVNAIGNSNSGVAIFDFEPSNFTNGASFQLNGADFTGVLNPIPNISSDDVKVKFSKCFGIKNTYVGSQYTVSSEVATTFANTVDFVKALGTTVYSDEVWFDSDQNNSFRYIGNNTIFINVHGVINLVGSANKICQIKLRKFIAVSNTYVDISPVFEITTNAGGRVEGVSVLAISEIQNNDRIELFILNSTDTSSITLKLGGILIISERQS